MALRLDPVRTLQELREKVKSVLDINEEIILFGGSYNGASRQTGFVSLTSTQQLRKLKGQGDKPILLRYARPGSKTPPSSPEQDLKEVPSATVQGENLFCLPVTFCS